MSRRRSRSSLALAAILAAVAAMPGSRSPVEEPGSRLELNRLRTADAVEPPAGLTRAEWTQLQGAVEASSYHAGRVAKAGGAAELVARNRRQRYGATFRRAGIELASQVPAGKDWRLGLSLTGFGRAGDVRPLPWAEPQARKERVEYRRGPLTEWYVNRPGGLEQGFEIAAAPAGGSGPLVVALSVEGDLGVALEGEGAVFADGSGQTVLRYAGLRAWDAEGRGLAARMEAEGRELRLVVQAQAARFPVTVDPTFRQEAKLLGQGDILGGTAHLGLGVAVSGDTAVIGASGDDTVPGGQDAGSAYVFVRSGATWIEQQKLLPPNGAPQDYFGGSVGISGDTVVVGQSRHDSSYGVDVGAACVFVRSGTTWTLQGQLLASDGAAGDWFGQSVAISGDTVVVGAPRGDTSGGQSAGSAYVFVRSGTTWTEQRKLTASDGGTSDNFGDVLAISGDTVVVGASAMRPGSAYVFARSGVTWTEQQKLLPADGGVRGDFFGYSVAISGDTALVGGRGVVGGGVVDGAVYVFVRAGATWSQQQKLLAPDGAYNDDFGGSVAISADTAVVGASGDDTPGGPSAGSAYVFARSGATWSFQQKLLAPDGAAGDHFGYPVAISGDTAVVGANDDQTAGGIAAGSAHVFVRSDAAWTHQQQLQGSDGALNDFFGYPVAVSGDTAVVGAYVDDSAGHFDAGSAYVFVRSRGGWTLQQKLLAPDGASDDYFGVSVGVSGDTAVVGAYADNTVGGFNAGSAYVFVRSGGSWTMQQKLTASDGGASDLFGVSVALSGDTAVVGAYGDDTAGGEDAGSAYVFVRSGGAWTEQQRLTASDGGASDLFGLSVAVSGETALVGAYRDDTAVGQDAGSAYVFVRSGASWTEQQKLLAADAAALDLFGVSVALSGDTAVVGAYLDDIPGAVDAGSAYVFVRPGSGWTQQAQLLAPDGARADQFGIAVAISGDTAVVRAYADDTTFGLNTGSAYVFGRSGGTWTVQQKLRASDGAAVDLFGYAVAIDGDTVVVGAPEDDGAGGSYSGSAHVYGLFAKGDIDLDGQTDLLVRQGTTGHNEAWLMNGGTRLGAPVGISPEPDSLDWSVAGTDDFNGDRRNDLLFWNSVTGAAEFWLMDGATRMGDPVPLAGAPPPPWKPSALADFDNDGQPDIVYRNASTRKIAVWTMNGTAHDETLVPNPDQAAFNWELVGAQDWNADGDTDLLWYNVTSGKLALWFMDASVVRITGQFTNPPKAANHDWKVLTMGDYGNGPAGVPGTLDLVWRHATSGKFVVWYMDQAGNRTSGAFTTPDAPGPNPTDWTIVGPR